MHPVSLPAIGVTVTLCQLTGVEDMMLLEAPPITTIEAELALSTALVERLAVAPDDAPIDWRDVPITDLDILLLWLRRAGTDFIRYRRVPGLCRQRNGCTGAVRRARLVRCAAQ